jgi:hypothetical protein
LTHAVEAQADPAARVWAPRGCTQLFLHPQSWAPNGHTEWLPIEPTIVLNVKAEDHEPEAPGDRYQRHIAFRYQDSLNNVFVIPRGLTVAVVDLPMEVDEGKIDMVDDGLI